MLSTASALMSYACSMSDAVMVSLTGGTLPAEAGGGSAGALSDSGFKFALASLRSCIEGGGVRSSTISKLTVCQAFTSVQTKLYDLLVVTVTSLCQVDIKVPADCQVLLGKRSLFLESQLRYRPILGGLGGNKGRLGCLYLGGRHKLWGDTPGLFHIGSPS